MSVADSDQNRGDLQDLQRQWIECFISTMNILRMYHRNHPESQEHISSLRSLTIDLQEGHDGEVSLSYSDGTVAVNHFVIDPASLSFRRLAEEIRQRNIHSLIFSRGLDTDELTTFLELFSDRPKNIVARGGMALLMEESGIRNIRLAGLKYAGRARLGTNPHKQSDDDRLLFARMEECLKDSLSSEGGDMSSQLVTFLENPKTTAKFLEQQVAGEEVDAEFVQEVVSTLEQAGTIVYTRQPQHWNRTKQNIASALTMLTPKLREKVLEQACEEQEGTLLLEEMVQSLSPEQIATILADYVLLKEEEIEPVEDPGFFTTRKDNPTEPRQPQSSRLIQQLIHSPEHFQMMVPMLMQEFDERGMHMPDYEELFGPLCGDYFERIRGNDLAPMSADKVMIFRTAGQADEQQREEIRDLLETMNESDWEKSFQAIREEILKLETDGRVYREVLGAQMIRQATEAFETGDFETTRNCLRPILLHAVQAREEPFKDRAKIAKEMLIGFGLQRILESFLEQNCRTARFHKDLAKLIQLDETEINTEIVRLAFDLKTSSAFRNQMRWTLGTHLKELGAEFKIWIQQQSPVPAEEIFSIVENRLSDSSITVLKTLANEEQQEVSRRALRLLGQLGGPRAEFALLTIAQNKEDESAQIAEDELCRLRSPLAVILIEDRLKEKDFWGSRKKVKPRDLQVLHRINDAGSRRVLSEFLTHPRSRFQRKRDREAMIQTIENTSRWPKNEAQQTLHQLLKYPDKSVALAAREQFLRIRQSLWKPGTDQ